MRVPSGYVTEARNAGDPYKTVYDTWHDDDFHPDFDADFHPGLYSRDGHDRDVYKSPIVECAWDKVEQVRIEGLKN